MDIKDLPLNKLIDTVAQAIGVLYEPTRIKRIAKAEADVIQQISEAVRKNDDLAIAYNDGKIAVNKLEPAMLVERAKSRMAIAELKKQYNIDSVMEKAIDCIEQVEEVSEQSVDADWIYDFFEKVANVSNAQMQQLWAKILVGEICTPGSYSKRTLDVLAKLSSQEAVLYSKIVPLVLNCQDSSNEFGNRDYFIPSYKDILRRYNISYDVIFRLNNAGLIDSNELVCAGPEIPPNGVGYICHGDNQVLKFENKSEETIKKQCGVYLLTREGMELLSVAESIDDSENMEEYLRLCKSLFD